MGNKKTKRLSLGLAKKITHTVAYRPALHTRRGGIVKTHTPESLVIVPNNDVIEVYV